MAANEAERGRALKGASETLFIPLSARALARRKYPKYGFSDPAAEDLAERLKVDTLRYAWSDITAGSCILRAQWFDRICADFIRRHDDAVVLSLGSGLNTMYERVAATAGQRMFRWIDSDLPDVVALRRDLFPEDRRRVHKVLDLNAPDLLSEAGIDPGAPLLAVAEGLLMYLPPSTVRRTFRALHAAGAEAAFDWASPIATRAGRLNPALLFTRDRSVRFTWHLTTPRLMRGWRPPWRAVESFDLISGTGLAGAAMQRLHRLFNAGQWLYGCTHARPI
ncbi:MAG: class I SAM-dependent methyltransferase [Micropepsaceae bacterium]